MTPSPTLSPTPEPTREPLEPGTARVRFFADYRTAWRHAYNVYRLGEHIGFVYRGSDERWHSIALDGRREGGWRRRSDAAYFLTQPAAPS